jgi:hypothetical protein
MADNVCISTQQQVVSKLNVFCGSMLWARHADRPMYQLSQSLCMVPHSWQHLVVRVRGVPEDGNAQWRNDFCLLYMG